MGQRTKLKGKDLMLWVDGSVVALSTDCTLDMTANLEDSASKDDGQWGNSEVSGFEWEATNESIDAASADANAADIAYDALFDKMVSGKAVEVTLGVPSNASDAGLPDAGWTKPTAGVYAGNALITKLTRKGTKGSNATASVSLKGVGELKRITSTSK
jgi:hypothetical protein